MSSTRQPCGVLARISVSVQLTVGFGRPRHEYRRRDSARRSPVAAASATALPRCGAFEHGGEKIAFEQGRGILHFGGKARLGGGGITQQFVQPGRKIRRQTRARAGFRNSVRWMKAAIRRKKAIGRRGHVALARRAAPACHKQWRPPGQGRRVSIPAPSNCRGSRARAESPPSSVARLRWKAWAPPACLSGAAAGTGRKR